MILRHSAMRTLMTEFGGYVHVIFERLHLFQRQKSQLLHQPMNF